MHIFFNSKLIPVVMLLLLTPALAYAEAGERPSTAIALGWFSIGSGIVANLSLVAFKMVRKIQLTKLVGGYEATSNLAPFYKHVLNFHIMLNSVGLFAGLSHGLLLIRGLDYISFSLAIVMTFSMVSGILLKYASDKNLKFFGKLAHGQFILAVMLVVLVALHVITMGGDFD